MWCLYLSHAFDELTPYGYTFKRASLTPGCCAIAFNHTANNDAEAEYDRLRDQAREEASKRNSCFDRVSIQVSFLPPFHRSLLPTWLAKDR